MTAREPSQLTSYTARRVRELRHERGLSARELSERCIAMGAPSLTRGTIAKIESGVRRDVTIDEAAALAQALGIAFHELLQSPTEPPEPRQDYAPMSVSEPAVSAPPRSRAGTEPAASAQLTAERAAAELGALHRGWGMQASDLESRLGPLMRELAGTAAAATSRQALQTEVSRCIAELPDDLRPAAEASLALSAETMRMQFFRDRVNWLADQTGRDARTALRRVKAAERLLAGIIASELRGRRGRTTVALSGWCLKDARTVVRLDTPTAEALEQRLIVSTRENLTEVMAWLDMPTGPGQPSGFEAEILFGGELIRVEQPSPNRFHLVVRLPVPLQPGEEHMYGLRLRMARGVIGLRYYIFTPECQCNNFDLTVRFDAKRLPGWVRRVEGETVRMFEEPHQTDSLLPLDTVGEVSQKFHDLTMYLGYGIQWGQQESGVGWETHG
jgi:transcriptional regulator with XRE-family HTH domain